VEGVVWSSKRPAHAINILTRVTHALTTFFLIIEKKKKKPSANTKISPEMNAIANFTFRGMKVNLVFLRKQKNMKKLL
jgi:hypothetical protein